MGKGGIACYEKFLLFPQCFQGISTADTYKTGLVWERVKEQMTVLYFNLRHKAIEIDINHFYLNLRTIPL